MIDWAQVEGGKQLLADVTALKASMHGDKVVLDDGTSLNTALADLADKVNFIRGKTGTREEKLIDG